MHPSATWADVLLKRGQALLESLQAARAHGPEVAVLPTADAPKPGARKKARTPKAKRKARR